MSTSTPAWSIAVKTVGEQSDFVIHVSPDDALTSMNAQIEEFTGLKASQQRLIYRGRIIRNNATEPGDESVKKEPKVKDVVGLANGQTIHLVPRPEAEAAIEDEVMPELAEVRPQPGAATISRPDSEPGTAALLAALLGLGSMDDDTDENASLGQQLARMRSARVRNRSRRPNHRLTSSDLEVPDPGSMEPVRQGLLTLHTIGDSLRNTTDASPKHRQWYRGQWIDCRDTVNQWLEATVVQVIQPQDILPVALRTTTCSNSNTRVVAHPTTDPAVSANDVEGRMRLLLEPTDDCSGGEWGGFQQRNNNEGVNLILIHYNGWPHRWDEWIRSDSERIRPFRTRTRHPNGVRICRLSFVAHSCTQI
jgi:hypothetical protein